MTDDLRALAEAATPGTWGVMGQSVIYDAGQCNCGPGGENGLHENYCGVEVLAEASPADAAYIAAANPVVVRALLDEQDRLTEMLNTLGFCPTDGESLPCLVCGAGL